MQKLLVFALLSALQLFALTSSACAAGRTTFVEMVSMDLIASTIYLPSDTIIIIGGINGISVSRDHALTWKNYRLDAGNVNFNHFETIDDRNVLVLGMHALQGSSLYDSELYKFDIMTGDSERIGHFSQFIPRMVHRKSDTITVVGTNVDQTSNIAYYTTDSGASWYSSAFAVNSVPLYKYVYLADNLIYAFSSEGAYISTDGGYNWQHKYVEQAESEVYYVKACIDYIMVSDNYGNVFKSVDQGDNWQKILHLTPDNNHDFSAYAADTSCFGLLIVDASGGFRMIYTANSGNSYEEAFGYSNMQIIDFVVFRDGLIICAGGSGYGMNYHPLLIVRDSVDVNGIVNVQGSNINIFPNPADYILHVPLATNDTYTIEIFDTFGQKIDCNFMRIEDELLVVTKNLVGGMYFARLQTNGSVFVTKFVKQ